MYKKYFAKRNFDEGINDIIKQIKKLNNEKEISSYIDEIELYIDELLEKEVINYEEYDELLNEVWKIQDKIIFNNEGIKIQDTLNMIKEKGKIEVDDIVTFKIKDSFSIPIPYKVVKIEDNFCFLINLLNNKKYKTKLSYLDKRNKMYLNQNFGKDDNDE